MSGERAGWGKRNGNIVKIAQGFDTIPVGSCSKAV